jgi:hypothetical protein
VSLQFHGVIAISAPSPVLDCRVWCWLAAVCSAGGDDGGRWSDTGTDTPDNDVPCTKTGMDSRAVSVLVLGAPQAR